MNRRLHILLLLVVAALSACSLPEFGPRQTRALPVERLEGLRNQAETGAVEIEAVTFPAPTAAAFAAQATAVPTAQPPAGTIPWTTIEFPYSVQAGSPALVGNFLNPGAGCDWMGVAGQVFDRSGRPVTGLIVEVGGRLNGRTIGPLVSMTGSTPALGPAGYAVTLSTIAADTNHSFYVQVNNLDGNPLTRRVYFDTSSSCEQNLVLINFVEQTDLAYVLNLPLIHIDYAPFSLKLPLIHR